MVLHQIGFASASIDNLVCLACATASLVLSVIILVFFLFAVNSTKSSRMQEGIRQQLGRR